VGVKEFYVHDESLTERGLSPEDLVMDVEIVNSEKLNSILNNCSAILPF
jgi:sulfur relay (sulfurtransferase) DsrF/TusC family protein